MSEEGKKFDENKPRTDLLSREALIKIAEVMGRGANKYGAHNWKAGIAWSRVLAALLRHVLAFLDGEDKDPETGLSHMAHAGCCVMFLLEYEKTHTEFDDRYKPERDKIVDKMVETIDQFFSKKLEENKPSSFKASYLASFELPEDADITKFVESFLDTNKKSGAV